MHFVMHHRTGEEMRECASAKYPCEGAHDHLYDYDPPPSERLRKPCSLCASAFEAIRSIAAGEGPRRTDAERLDAILAIVEGK